MHYALSAEMVLHIPSGVYRMTEMQSNAVSTGIRIMTVNDVKNVPYLGLGSRAGSPAIS